jgi:hypothetical protein
LHWQGGYWLIRPAETERIETLKQFYWPDTNILITRFFTPMGVGEVRDYMPVHPKGHKRKNMNNIIRQILIKSGCMSFVMECIPTFDYARKRHQVAATDDGVEFRTDELSMVLRSSHPLKINSQKVTALIRLEEYQTATFIFHEKCCSPQFSISDVLIFFFFFFFLTDSSFWKGTETVRLDKAVLENVALNVHLQWAVARYCIAERTDSQTSHL